MSALSKIHNTRKRFISPRIMFLNYNKTMKTAVHCLNIYIYIFFLSKCEFQMSTKIIILFPNYWEKKYWKHVSYYRSNINLNSIFYQKLPSMVENQIIFTDSKGDLYTGKNLKF